MSLFKFYNKSKINSNKSFNGKRAISFKAYDLLKKYVINGTVSQEKLDSAYPKNTKLNIIKNVSQRSMKTFYKLSDKYLVNKYGIISQISNKKKIPHKKKLSRKAKELLSKINNDLPRYDNIDMLIKKIKNK